MFSYHNHLISQYSYLNKYSYLLAIGNNCIIISWNNRFHHYTIDNFSLSYLSNNDISSNYFII